MRRAVAAGLIGATVLGGGYGISVITEKQVVANKVTQIPIADHETGDVTIGEVCDTAKELAETANLPPGVERSTIADNCTDEAVDLIMRNESADVTGKDVVVAVTRDWLGNYAISAQTLEEARIKQP